ncbi:Galactokinase galactose-binding signature [Fragilaria crotonensis]|nr:Galactokinase galactose-binding signature [Fragilaria crotonensis]
MTITLSTLSPALQKLVEEARGLYIQSYGSSTENFCTVAPGRVNLIGEHTDYTGGFVLPLAIDYGTVVYGSGAILEDESTRTSEIELISGMAPDKVEKLTIDADTKPPSADEHNHWTNYVLGVVAQYLPDLPQGTSFSIKIAIAGNVPLGGGLSSSASLEVATARFLECILGDSAFSSSTDKLAAKVRALRCQKAENVWCHSPCGIMDQYVSSAASEGALLLIDCTSFEYQKVHVKQPSSVVLVVTNSNVKHDIAGGEYPVRVAQCRTATVALQKFNKGISTLRDATLQDVLAAEADMDEISFRRARHVVTENARTLAAKDALEDGDWALLGSLMNDSHTSMRDDYEVSCSEIDVLVDLAQTFSGVYGSRLTGGGFGGCTVTLVEKESAPALMEYLKKEYKVQTGTDCDCFETSPGPGARLLGTDSV